MESLRENQTFGSQALSEQGVLDMREDGMNKVLLGLTSIEEVARVVPWEGEET